MCTLIVVHSCNGLDVLEGKTKFANRLPLVLYLVGSKSKMFIQNVS